jgi:hypothetical protein
MWEGGLDARKRKDDMGGKVWDWNISLVKPGVYCL